jgi:hypothetical protein
LIALFWVIPPTINSQTRSHKTLQFMNIIHKTLYFWVVC